MTNKLNRWLLPLLLFVISGCAGFGGYREGVRVSVSNIEVLETTLMEQLYRITLRIQNRNDQSLTVNGGSFDLKINGRDFGSGVTATRVTVPPYADAKIDVRMVSTLFGMMRLVQGFQDRNDQTLTYEISGRFSIEETFGGLSFTESGEISLPSGDSTKGGEGL